ncbi:MAG TPA: ComEA family DNA-binding protein [Thermotogota bacterium]|nr:ComEA family DNA-binding protein [Thermotogota bacterium]HRW34245.1 ComEA family DNA-binding protein [Thermotogota bacterium]
MNKKEKLVLIALACVFVLGVVFSIKDLNVPVLNSERQAYDEQAQAIRTGMIDLNKADAMQLQLLKGIGDTKADAIVAYRQSNGPFAKKEDVMNVPGIGPATYEKIKDRLELSYDSIQSIAETSEADGEGLIDINRASQKELEKIPGIGPVKAKNIVDYREQNGYFQDIADLILVTGIGEKTLETMKTMITINQ